MPQIHYDKTQFNVKIPLKVTSKLLSENYLLTIDQSIKFNIKHNIIFNVKEKIIFKNKV